MKKKVGSGFKILLIIALLILAGWLSFGVAGNMVLDYRQTNFIKTTQGTATELSQVDPHVAKAQSEYNQIIELVDSETKIAGLYEKINAGDYAYASLTEPDAVGQYNIESFIFTTDLATAKTSFEKIQTRLLEYGYVVNEQATNSETQVEYYRQFIPSNESSQGTPGKDRVLITLNEKPEMNSIMFSYRGTETPLNGIPDNKHENYSVTEVDKLWQQVIDGDIDLCKYEPNGAIGGWNTKYECQQKYF